MYKEIEFDTGRGRLAGKLWQVGSGTPVMAFHGWQDNAASFDVIANALAQTKTAPGSLLALDLSGHGKSHWRQHLGAYNIWTDLADIICIADEMKWDTFGVMGHSRGAMVATLLAATLPERVSGVALVEGILPQVIEESLAPQQLREALISIKKLKARKRSYYESFDMAVQARENGFLQVAREDAEALAARGVSEHENKFYWHHDPLLAASSEFKLTRKQRQAFVENIQCPLHLVFGSKGLLKPNLHVVQEVFTNKDFSMTEMEGDHHLHMSSQGSSVAKIFAEFFSKLT